MWSLRPQSLASTALLPPPALRERRHRGLARWLVVVRRRAVFVVSEGERPHPRRPYWRSVNLEDAAHNFAIGTHVALPIVGRAVVVVVPGGVVTTVVGADVWIAKSAFLVINPQISATIGVAKQALRHGFIVVDARNVSFCCLSRHGQNCSRHHRENAEQGVAGLAHSPLRSIQSARGVAQGPHTRFEGSSSVLVGRHDEPGRDGTL